MVPYGPLWSPLIPYGPVWSCMVPYGPIWSRMVTYGHVWSHMVPYGPVWSSMVPFCPVWSLMVPYDPLWFCMVFEILSSPFALLSPVSQTKSFEIKKLILPKSVFSAPVTIKKWSCFFFYLGRMRLVSWAPKGGRQTKVYSSNFFAVPPRGVRKQVSVPLNKKTEITSSK